MGLRKLFGRFVCSWYVLHMSPLAYSSAISNSNFAHLLANLSTTYQRNLLSKCCPLRPLKFSMVLLGTILLELSTIVHTMNKIQNVASGVISTLSWIELPTMRVVDVLQRPLQLLLQLLHLLLLHRHRRLLSLPYSLLLTLQPLSPWLLNFQFTSLCCSFKLPYVKRHYGMCGPGTVWWWR